MRKYFKKVLNEKLQELIKKHFEIDELINKQQLRKAEEVLTECQEKAILTGNFIETEEADSEEIIRYLEEYCERIYEWNVSLAEQTKERKDYNKIVNLILKKVKEQIDILHTEYEVVFLAYKASMWDSLESIWKAAKRDKDFKTYVIVVPYFSKESDGRYKEMVCEKTKFPKEVPVTDYSDYKIEERHPDIIFFHNPYDQTNVITSVHPDYYAKHIRNYTDMLVYVPYFVTRGYIKEQYCILPGVLYAHRVMVETEEIRQQYIRHYKKVFEEAKVDVTEEAELKFVAKGSPKWDKVLITSKTDYELPDEWRVKVSNRIVVLYNTHISKLMDGDANKTLKKIESVLRYFKEQDEFMLWWRPHPLSMETARAVGEQTLKKYEMLVSKYKNEDWGIYDDTAELYRAIAYSDAYYGDESSLTALFKNVGKPVLIQKYSVRNVF